MMEENFSLVYPVVVRHKEDGDIKSFITAYCYSLDGISSLKTFSPSEFSSHFSPSRTILLNSHPTVQLFFEQYAFAYKGGHSPNSLEEFTITLKSVNKMKGSKPPREIIPNNVIFSNGQSGFMDQFKLTVPLTGREKILTSYSFYVNASVNLNRVIRTTREEEKILLAILSVKRDSYWEFPVVHSFPKPEEMVILPNPMYYTAPMVPRSIPVKRFQEGTSGSGEENLFLKY